MRRSFSTRSYPTFGRDHYDDANPPTTVTSSPYYWWFRFLQLNGEYKKAVAGEVTSINPSIALAMGDVSAFDFKTWWNHHAHLFAEPVTQQRMIVARSLADLAEFNSTEAVNLVVPLSWSNVGLKRRFNQLIDQLVPKTPRGVHVQASEAEYRLGRKWSISAFENAYKIYKAKSNADATVSDSGRQTPWADIAIRAGLRVANGLSEGELTIRTSDARRTLTVLAMRHYERARVFIAAAATNEFPR